MEVDSSAILDLTSLCNQFMLCPQWQCYSFKGCAQPPSCLTGTSCVYRLTLEQCGFKLGGYTYTQIFFFPINTYYSTNVTPALLKRQLYFSLGKAATDLNDLIMWFSTLHLICKTVIENTCSRALFLGFILALLVKVA